ncbi:hypothetical protein HanRHA438_Chr15g0710091 [Helianthus annuus]|uniref:Uncharacterized protein n=1 Tax=Helianthus annuus TaxID=4232 RepID=A0A251S8Z6_HELAN|nr:hypothetical protein HanRHA438_Chr15g0710091 [Helianthus annuus]
MGGGFYPDGDDDERWWWWFEQAVIGIGGRSGGGCGWSLRRWCLSMDGANGGVQIGCGGHCPNNPTHDLRFVVHISVSSFCYKF